MIHKMGLYEEYFALIKAGKKKVEVRLNNEKRRKLRVEDTILVLNPFSLKAK